MTDKTMVSDRRYRFSPLVKTGLFGTMPTSQVVVLSIGCGLSFVGILLRLFPWALLPVVVSAVVGFKRVGGWALHEVIPLRLGWLANHRRHSWFRPVPMLTPSEHGKEDLPSPMDGLRMLDVDASWITSPRRLAGVGVIHDNNAGLLTGVLRVDGDGQFSLTSADAQDGRVALWGDALAGFCRERLTVCRIVWQEWSTSTSVEAPGLGGQSRAAGLADAAGDYIELITHAAPRSVTHDTLVSMSIDLAAMPTRRNRGGDSLANGLQLLTEELRLFTTRLEGAGLHVDPPLTPAELTIAVRSRSGPFAEAQAMALSTSLAVGLGVTTSDLAPMAVREEWDHVRVDRAIHRSWWVEGWPRLEVPAAWMDLLLLGGECTRTVTVVFEPISPSQAARSIDEASVALESTEAAKSKRGFRIRAGERRLRDEVERREHELVAGYGDLAYCGLVSVAARTLDELDDAAADFEQSAAHAGVQLRALEGRHGAGWVAGLPLGRTLAARNNR
jgi:hypothetical protein